MKVHMFNIDNRAEELSNVRNNSIVLTYKRNIAMTAVPFQLIIKNMQMFATWTRVFEIQKREISDHKMSN
jgi:hypothetical protein